MTKTVSNLTIGTSRVEITLDRASLPQPAFPAGYVSFTGSISGGGSGQIVDGLAELTENADVQAVCDYWRAYHMKNDAPDLDQAVALLKRLDGQHIDRPDTADSEDPDDCTFSNADYLIDSREVISRIEYLEAFTEDHPDHDDAARELKILRALENDAEGYAADWHHGKTLIRDSYFEDYARDLAEDIGAIKSDAGWPYEHIDWPAAAAALQGDYTSVEFDGVTYWIR
jgi:hypothetical protein